MRTFTVVSTEGEIIALVSSEERNRLLGRNPDGSAPCFGAPEYPYFPNGVPIYNQKMIRSHRKLDKVYVAEVEPSIIRAELRRDIGQRVPVAEDCVTATKVFFANERGSGWYFQHVNRRAFAYGNGGRNTDRHQPQQHVASNQSQAFPLAA